MMEQHIAHISLLVHDYDEALDFYVQKLSFTLIEDTVISDTKRWVLIKPPGSIGCSILLAKAVGDQQQAAVGNQSGGRVFLFLYTDNFWRDYNLMTDNGVQFVRSPQTEPYGTIAVFEDLYGNLWDLIEPVR
jgi:catechol 2,3-dioxygenase-like lactoylglutathione lyase family enzyme